jgi:hypothetical protein
MNAFSHTANSAPGRDAIEARRAGAHAAFGRLIPSAL